MPKKKIITMSFEEIKSLFEHKSYFIRAQFLNEYHFNDSFQDYYNDFIAKNAFTIKSNGYLSDLICFTIDFNFFDPIIMNTWYQLLKKSSSTIVTLSILDYFNGCALRKLPGDYVDTLWKLSQKRMRTTLKNQIYFNLLSFDESNERYKLQLIDSLKKTKDAKSILRTISCLSLLNSGKVISEIKEEILHLHLDFLDDGIKTYILKKVCL